MDFSNEQITHIDNSGVQYLQYNQFTNIGLTKHCFTTRLGGVSRGDYSSLNLKRGLGDDDNDIERNYKIICNELGIEYDNIVYCNQVHGNTVEVLYQKPNKVLDIDGFITNVPNIALVTNYADCVPLLFIDPVKRVIGNSHAGWKGTVKKIGQETIKKMVDTFKCEPKDILAAIGPSIGKCCFETDNDVYSQFKENFDNIDSYCEKNGDKYNIDIWELNKLQLMDVGVPDENITVSRICTVCNTDYFFSYRGENGKTGRMGSIIQLI